VKPETCAAAILSRGGEAEPLALNSVALRLELPALIAMIILVPTYFGSAASLFKMVFHSHLVGTAENLASFCHSRPVENRPSLNRCTEICELGCLKAGSGEESKKLCAGFAGSPGNGEHVLLVG
jgi:hypothetical protein